MVLVAFSTRHLGEQRRMKQNSNATGVQKVENEIKGCAEKGQCEKNVTAKNLQEVEQV